MKGIAGLVIMAIIVIGAIAVGGVISYGTIKMAKSTGYSIMFEEKKLIESQAHYDGEKQFLRNSLWLAGENSTYENGQNGGLYETSWGKCGGYVCWKKNNYPRKNLVARELEDKINDTYRDSFGNFVNDLDVEVNRRMIDNPYPSIEMHHTNSKITLQYDANLYLKNSFLNQTIEENEKIETDLPLRYFLLYDKAKTLVTGSDIDDYIFDEINGTEEPDKTKIKNGIENALDKLKGKYTGDIKLDISLLGDITLTKKTEPNWEVNYTLKVNFYDNDNSRRIPTSGGLKKLSLVFATQGKTEFEEEIEEEKLCGTGSGELCEGYDHAECKYTTTPCDGFPYCTDNTRFYNCENTGTQSDCDAGGTCICYDEEECSYSCENGECQTPSWESKYVSTSSLFSEYTTSKSCSPYNFCVFIDDESNKDREAEMTFDISSISGNLEYARVCAYRYNYYADPVENYIEKISDSTCDNAPYVSSPDTSWKRGDITKGYGWKCIDITDMLKESVNNGDDNLFIRWWGNDRNGEATGTHIACYEGLSDLSNCGGSNPSGASDCRPYIEYWTE